MLSLLVALLIQDPVQLREVTVDLPADGSVVVAGESVPWAEIAVRFKRHRDLGIRLLVIRADGAVPFSSVQRVVAAAREVGIERAEVSSEKPVPERAFAAEPPSLRIKIREGAKGLEIILLQESYAGSLEDLAARLKKLERMPVILDVEPEVSYGVVKRVFDACTGAGLEKISFAARASRSDAIRVLLAESGPRYEYRFLKNLLERSEDFRLEIVLTSADPEFPGVMREFPTDLSRFDVVLLGSLETLTHEQATALQDFVAAGGGLVWIGPEDRGAWLGNKLESICPVELEPVGSTIPPAELQFAAKDPLVKDLKWEEMSGKIHCWWKPKKIDGDAKVLVESQFGAFLVTQSVGKGRTVYVGAEDTWRLRYQTGDEPHFGPLWKSVLRWAVGK